MRRLWLLGLLLCGVSGFTWAVAGLGAPLTPVAHLHVHRGKASVIFKWTDTNSQAIVRTYVRRRSTGADTLWKMIGFTSAKSLMFIDPGVTSGKTYRYQAADSVAATALSPYSDSSTVVIP